MQQAIFSVMSRKRGLFMVLAAVLLLAFAFPFGGTAQAGGPPSILINEMQVSTTSSDWEFAEIVGTPGAPLTDLTLIGIESDFDNASVGTIDLAIDLTGNMPQDGYYVLANSIAESQYNITADQTLSGSFENSGATYLLVVGFNGQQGDDLDGNDDGTLDTFPWSIIYDGLAIVDNAGDFNYSSGPTVGPDGTFLPSGAFRCGDAPGGVFQTDRFLDFSTPNGTPGASNLPTCFEGIAINEMQVSTTGSDWEFVEISGPVGTALNGLVLVGIESDTDSPTGTIDTIIELGGTISTSGFFVAANGLAETTYSITADQSLTDSFENSSATYLLVAGFTGGVDEDLDTNDDGTADSAPWAVVIDGLAILDDDPTDFNYSDGPALGPDGTFLPSGVFRCPDGSEGAFQTDAFLNFSTPDGTPGLSNDPLCQSQQPTEQFIHQVQGSGASVVEPGALVTVEGVVVGDYQASDELSGFYLQEEDNDADADAATSEGIFVYCDDCAVVVSEGQIVQVTGLAEENFDQSQIDVTGGSGAVSITDAGDNSGLVTAATITLPVPQGTDRNAFFEPFEGMLVSFSGTLTATEYFELARYGQVVMSIGGKQRQFTNDNMPTEAGYTAHLDEVERGRIILDDLNNVQNIDPVYHPQPGGFAVDNFIRGGDTVTNMTGVLSWTWAGSSGTDDWRVRPQITNPVQFTRSNPRPATPAPQGDISVAAFNVLNYFNGDGLGGGFPTARGANSPDELLRQTAKIGSAMLEIDADIFGLMEIENDGGPTQAAASLVQALNSEAGAGTYAFIDTGMIGSDEIKVAIIYKPAVVSPVGSYAILDSQVDARFDDTRNRPALAQTFEVIEQGNNSLGERFTVVVNHLKSKGSSCGAGDDDTTTGQGNCNLTRTNAALAMVDWLNTDPTQSGDDDFLIIGDLNSYAMEDPIVALENGGYTDLLAQFAGGKANAYTYVFDGQWGYLDYALSSSSLTPQVVSTTAWAINADENSLLDYNDTIQDSGEQSFQAKPPTNDLYNPDQWRSSDHDPVIVGLSLGQPEALQAVTLTNPTGAIDAVNEVTLTWDAAFGADRYQVDVYDPYIQIFSQELQASAVCSGLTCSQTVTVNSIVGEYAVYIQARVGQDVASDWSLSTFTMELGAVALSAPSGQVPAGETVDLVFPAVSGAAYYVIDVYRPASSETVFVETANVCTAGTCTVTVNTNGEQGTFDVWIIAGVGPFFGEWSNASFTVGLPSVTLTSGNPVFGETATLTFAPPQGADYTVLDVYSPNGDSQRVLVNTVECTDVCSVEVATNFQLGEFQVWTITGIGSETFGNWTFNSFTVSFDDVTLSSPTGNVPLTAGIDLVFNMPAGAYYAVLDVYYPNGGFLSEVVELPDCVEGVCTVSIDSFGLSGEYGVWIIPGWGDQFGNWAFSSFTVDPADAGTLAADEVDVLGSAVEELPSLDTSEVEAAVEGPGN